MEDWVEAYGHAGVLLGAFLDSPTVLVLGGYAAARGFLSPPVVALAAFVGATLSGYSKFLLGRRFGAGLLARHPRWAPGAARGGALLARHRLGLALTYRFLYGLRAATPLALGAGGTGHGAFLGLNALGAALWAGAFTAAGYFFGAAAQALVHRVRGLDAAAVGAILAVGLAVRLLYRALRRRRGGGKGPGEG